MKIEKFEDIDAWQKARALNRRVYQVSKSGPFARDYALRDQIRRAAISIMSNIAEGFERGGDKEFLQYLSWAKGSCGEVRSQLYVAFDQEYVDQKEFDELWEQAGQTSRLISGFMRYLKASDLRGNKFKE